MLGETVKQMGSTRPAVKKWATIRGANHEYRYTLGRQWLDGEGKVAFVMLNPSRADHKQDDNTITRCIRWAQDWGYNALEVVNLYAFRSHDPRELQKAPDAVGPENDAFLVKVAGEADELVCAWGASRFARPRAAHVLELLREHDLKCLALTSDGSPHHPRGLQTTLRPRPFVRPTNGL